MEEGEHTRYFGMQQSPAALEVYDLKKRYFTFLVMVSHHSPPLRPY